VWILGYEGPAHWQADTAQLKLRGLVSRVAVLKSLQVNIIQYRNTMGVLLGYICIV
jgi:hypothetical protein